jgi:hypothetical protein
LRHRKEHTTEEQAMNVTLGYGKAVHAGNVIPGYATTPECGGNRGAERFYETDREVTCKRCLKAMAKQAEAADRNAYYAGVAETQDCVMSQAEAQAEHEANLEAEVWECHKPEVQERQARLQGALDSLFRPMVGTVRTDRRGLRYRVDRVRSAQANRRHSASVVVAGFVIENGDMYGAYASEIFYDAPTAPDEYNDIEAGPVEAVQETPAASAEYAAPPAPVAEEDRTEAVIELMRANGGRYVWGSEKYVHCHQTTSEICARLVKEGRVRRVKLGTWELVEETPAKHTPVSIMINYGGGDMVEYARIPNGDPDRVAYFMEQAKRGGVFPNLVVVPTPYPTAWETEQAAQWAAKQRRSDGVADSGDYAELRSRLRLPGW